MRAISTTICFIISLSACSFIQASDLRVASMGQLSLVLNDKDYQLNLYDFGQNPAWLIVDQQQTWLRPGFTIASNQGAFKRRYDPQRQHDLGATFESAKALDQQQQFHSLVGYRNFTLEQVDGAINRNPYQEHPFRIVDNSIGDINYWGPSVSAQYSRQAIQKKLCWGASLDYSIETGLKDQFPQPRTIYRSAGIGAGVAYRLSNRLAAGATINYTHIQEYIECLYTSTNETRTIDIKKFRNENLAIHHLGDLEQFLTTKIIRFGLQCQFQPIHFWESALAQIYHAQRLEAFESLKQPQTDGNWKLLGWEMHWKNRFRFSALPIRFAFSLDHNEIADYASDPSWTIIWGDDWLRENRIGVGLSYEPEKGPLILGIEYYHALANKSKKDYEINPILASGKIEQSELRVGAEFRLFETLNVRGGYLVAQNIIDPALLQFSEFLPGHNLHQFSSGLAYTIHAVEVETHAYFSNRTPTSSTQREKRNTFGFMMTMTFYQN